MNINPSWNYKDIVANIRTLRLQYNEVLTSFNYVRDENSFIKKTRDSLYALHIEGFQKDRIWEYMNGYLSSIEIFILFGFLEEDKNVLS